MTQERTSKYDNIERTQRLIDKLCRLKRAAAIIERSRKENDGTQERLEGARG